MPTLDTSVLLRWLLDDVAEQTASADALIASGVECVIPDAALLETIYVLERVMRLPRRSVAEAVEAVFAVPHAEFDRSVWRAALDDYLAHPKLSISDALLGARARATKRLPLFTFDRKLASQVDGATLLI